jgi:hypothetical protein
VDGPEASYAVLLRTPGNRIYCFYNHNTDRVPEVKREDGGVYQRVDSLGHYVFKYSDDGGRSWSARRYEVPVREFACDRTNIYGGKLRFFWNVGRPLIVENAALLVLHKVGAMGPGFFAQSEGAFLRSDNILTEPDPEKVRFETLPEGEVGLRTPAGGGRVSEEQSIVALSDGSLYCVYRTVDGWPASAYSRDGGRHWSAPQYAVYSPGGQRLKHSRAANFVWKCANGQYLYWFHNHGGAVARSNPAWDPYADRNPAWLVAGVERDTPQGRIIEWSQPEIALYDDDPYIRMSYPDLVEEDGKYYVTETQKNIGRLHELPAALMSGLFRQSNYRQVSTNGLILNLKPGQPLPAEVPMPKLPSFNQSDSRRPDHGMKDLRAGFSLDLWLRLESTAVGQFILDNRDEQGRGLLLATGDSGTIRLTLNDGRTECGWSTDAGTLKAGQRQHIVAIVDGGPKIITFVVDGKFCDGGEARQFGWGRFSPNLRTPTGAKMLRIAHPNPAQVLSLRIYNRYLRTSEAVGNYRAGI